MNLPSQEYLQSRIDYDPQTGIAKWKPVDESYGPTWKHFNSRDAGKLLGNKAYLKGNQYLVSKLLKILIYGSSDNLEIASKLVRKNALRTNTLSLLGIEQYVSYDHKTGDMRFLPRSNNPAFNGQYAGKSASKLHTPSGYCRLSLLKKDYLSHRVAWYLYYGVDPGVYVIDHIDCNKANNIITNLRLANDSLNTQNRKSTKGYSLERGKYRVRIHINSVNYTVGTYNTELEAKEAYKLAIKLYKPQYQFTEQEQAQLDLLYQTYPNCSSDLQRCCHELQVKAINYYVDAAVVQGPNIELNVSS
jgi:hypothetical protein